MQAHIMIGEEWRSLESLTVDRPKELLFGEVQDVASNGAILVHGTRFGKQAWYFLEPL